MRLWSVVLLVVMLLLQWPLWLGRASVLHLAEQRAELKALEAENADKQRRNQLLLAEIRDLKTGVAAYEERSRTELGMIRRDEIFFQIFDRARP